MIAQTPSPHTLPARAYLSQDIFARERLEVFGRAWIPVAHVSELSAPGRYVTVDIANASLIVLRDDHGALRALSNVCRHRASLLLRGKGSCEKIIRCPYHGWSYKQDGRLSAMSEAKGFHGIDPSDFCLPSYPIGELAGLIFVSLDPDIEPLPRWFGDLERRLAPLNLPALELKQVVVEEHDQNWKVLADNFLEGYHIPLGHPGLFRLLDYKRYSSTRGSRYSWIDAPFKDAFSRAPLEQLYQRFLKPFPGFPADLSRQWSYIHLWPATFFDIYPDQIETWELIPLAVRKTRAVSRIYAPARESLRARVVRRINYHLNDIVTAEDASLCQGVQAGLETGAYHRGILHRCEEGVLYFHEMLRQAVPGIDDDTDQPTRRPADIAPDASSNGAARAGFTRP